MSIDYKEVSFEFEDSAGLIHTVEFEAVISTTSGMYGSDADGRRGAIQDSVEIEYNPRHVMVDGLAWDSIPAELRRSVLEAVDSHVDSM